MAVRIQCHGRFFGRNPYGVLWILRDKYSPSILWPISSMLRTTIMVKHGANLKQYDQLKAFIKVVNKGYEPNGAKDLEDEHVQKFLSEAPGSTYLADKVKSK